MGIIDTMTKTVTLAGAMDRYLKTVSCEKKGWQQELYRANVIKRYAIARKAFNKITSVDIASYRDERLATVQKKSGNKISGNSVRLELAFLSSIFKVAQTEWGIVKLNPVLTVRKPKVGKGRERRITAKEEKAINDYFKRVNPEMGKVFQLAIETAMRQGEILSLKWEDINLSLGVAHLPETKNGTSRDVPLSKKAREILLSMIPLLSGRVFRFTSNSFKSRWRTAKHVLAIEDLHFHDTRHEAISRFFELGTLNIMEVAAITGHKSLAMLKRYTHLKAYQLVRKIDSKSKSTKKVASYFIPYPALAEWMDDRFKVTFIDFEDITVAGNDKQTVIEQAAMKLLKKLAVAAQSGIGIPSPGAIGNLKGEVILINPLL